MAASLLALRRSTAALASTSSCLTPASSTTKTLPPTTTTRQHQQRRKTLFFPPSSSAFSPTSPPPPARRGRRGRAVFAQEDPSRSSSSPSAKEEEEEEEEEKVDKLDLDLEEEEELEPELDKTPRARPSPKGSLSKPNGLAASAAAFAADVRAGVSPEDAAAAALGAREAKALSEAQKKYADKVAAALAAKAEADARAKAERARKFELGKALYAKGMYPQSVRALVAALDAEGPFSQVGGEIQLWLALAHSATGDEAAAIAVYKEVEASHPSPKMRKQAYELRYIAEAPKLRVGADEKPQLPEVEPPRIGGEKGDRRRAPRPPPAPMGVKPKRTRPLTLEEKFMEEYRPPNLLPNKYVAVAAGVVAVAAAVYSARL